jgi:hypothetical protein
MAEAEEEPDVVIKPKIGPGMWHAPFFFFFFTYHFLS